MCVEDDVSKVLDDFAKDLDQWKRKAMRWRRMQFGFGGISIVLSLIIATFSTELALLAPLTVDASKVTPLKLITFFNALAIAAVSVYNMGDRATAARQACLELEAAMLCYKWDPEFTITHLTKAFKLAQATLGHPSMRQTTGK